MRANYYIIVGLLIACWNQPAAAAERGRVVLKNLCDGFHVYVDGQAVPASNGEVTMTTGKHEIQIEALSVPSGWQASVQTVRIRPNQTLVVNVKWAPVVFPERDNRLYIAGPQGPEGPRGPDAVASRSPAALGNSESQRSLLLEGLKSSISELDSLADSVEASERSTRIVGYYYQVNKPVQIEPGTSGNRGPEGVPGLPGQLFLIQDQNGSSLLELVKLRLGLEDMRRRLSTVRKELEHRQSGYVEIRILTPALRAKYKSLYASKVTEQAEHGEHPDIAGPNGPRGPRGVDGDVPRETPAVRLTDAQVDQLLVSISTREFQAERGRIANRIEILERSVVETSTSIGLLKP
jgi:hypothetical protein